MLHAAKRCLGRRHEARIEAHDSVVQRLGHAPRARQVARVAVGGEAKLRVVRQPDGLLVAGEAEERRDRTKRLLAREHHFGRDIGQHGRLEKAAAPRMTVTAGGKMTIKLPPRSYSVVQLAV